MKKEFNQLCVWPGTVVGDSKKVQKDFIKFFKDEMGVTVKYETNNNIASNTQFEYC